MAITKKAIRRTTAAGRGLRRWTSWETARVRDDGAVERQVLDVLLGSDGDAKGKMLRQMALLLGRPVDGAGFPPRAGQLDYEPADDEEPTIFRLKHKPTCWRTYFWPDDANARIVWLHIVCKKSREDKRRYAHAGTARLRLAEFRRGQRSVVPLEIPG